jgi:hypothetical protein
VLAVVRQKAVSILAQAGTSALNAFGAGEFRRVPGLHDQASTTRELVERHFFDGLTAKVPVEATVMNDASLAHVDAMMHIAPAWRRQMCSEWQDFLHGLLRVCGFITVMCVIKQDWSQPLIDGPGFNVKKRSALQERRVLECGIARVTAKRAVRAIAERRLRPGRGRSGVSGVT